MCEEGPQASLTPAGPQWPLCERAKPPPSASLPHCLVAISVAVGGAEHPGLLKAGMPFVRQHILIAPPRVLLHRALARAAVPASRTRLKRVAKEDGVVVVKNGTKE